jgi:hypothetical protein
MIRLEPPGAEPPAGWCGRGDGRNPVTSTRFDFVWPQVFVMSSEKVAAGLLWQL